MKYLKSINELLKISNDEFDDIRDVFQDLVDEFDLEKMISIDVPPDDPGIYYTFDNRESIESNNYMLLFILVRVGIGPKVYDKFKLLYNKLSDFKNRLKSMGYLVEYVETIENATSEVNEFGDLAIRISLIS